MIVPYTYNATNIGSLPANVSTSRLPNACLDHARRAARTLSELSSHDFKAWHMGIFSQGNGCLSTLTSSPSFGTASNDSAKSADEVVNMQAFVPAIPAFLDFAQEDVQPSQGAGHGGNLFPPCVPAPDAPLNPISGKVFENHPKLVMTLSRWAAEWLQSLVIRSHRLRGQILSYRGSPMDVCFVLASLISGVIQNMRSPVQVIIHALWYIVILTGDEGFNGESRDFSETPVFRLLYSKGSTYAEDFTLRTFVICAMVADKWVNDHPFPLRVCRARAAQLPVAILVAMESFVLQGLRWNVHMTPTQWKDMLTMLRSSEPSYVELDPFSVVPTPRSIIIVRILDKLTHLADAMETCVDQCVYDHDDSVGNMLSPSHQNPLHIHALQPIRPSTKSFVPLEWCPEADPIVNKKPRIIGIAPGTEDQYVLKPLTVCKLLDPTLKPSHSTKSVFFPRPLAASLHSGPFGTIGNRLTHTLNHSWPTWFPAQG
ncbi:hypothetical protein EDD17DRAFT_320010 [Pisolithus thermaeus]|nr:hypothetical protein EDD17DRAFT_320010 [Pisolithus thermaeus]